MTRSWVRQIRHVQPREGVRAGVVRRPDQSMEGRTDYLKERLDEAALGQMIVARDVPLHEDILESQPVYWNDTEGRFEPALAGSEADPASGAQVPTASSDCLGVVLYKSTATLGDVLLFGYAEMDITNAVDETPQSGRYYLSSQSAGKLVRQRPAVGVPVLFYDGDGHVFVMPSIHGFLEDHIHYRFELVARPAGYSSEPVIGERHTITNPDADRQGWLPASHSSFNGMAPAKAAFGYNLNAHPELLRVWPPVPLDAVQILYDKGRHRGGATDVPIGVDGLVVLDQYGIWWMSDCYGDVPWPRDFNSSISSSATSESSNPECPREETTRIIMGFAKMIFATDKSVVTSLKPFEGSPIRFVDCDGEEASTGNLFAKFISDFLIQDNDFEGNLALKALDGVNFKRGYMVQGVRSTNDNLSISGTRQKSISNVSYSQGLLDLTVNLEPSARDLPVKLVRLGNAKDRLYEGVMYIGFPDSTESSIIGSIKVPGAGLPASPKVKLRLQLFGRTAGTLPGLELTYRILSRPTSATALPTTDSALAIDTELVITASQYIEAESAAITVVAGDTIVFTLKRTGDDAYGAEVGLLDLVGILYAGT